jgi:hypothetical protein
MLMAFQERALLGAYDFAGMSAMKPDQWFSVDARSKWMRRARFYPFGGPREAWIFVTRNSLSSFIRSETREVNEGVSAPFNFDHDERRWRLFDAAVWIATGGRPTTTGAIASGDFETVGCKMLFAKLDEMELDAPRLTGIMPTLQVRSPIHTSWELTHTGWLGASGHLVMFYPVPGDQICADLIQFKHSTPTYTDIRIDREDLMKLFPPAPKVASPHSSAQVGEERRGRGRQKGAGAIDDAIPLAKVRELEQSGAGRFAATTEVATPMSDGTAEDVQRIRRRLLRKLQEQDAATTVTK